MNSLLVDVCLFFAKAGALSFGGGYAVLYLLQRELVVQRHWISPEDFVDVVAIAEMTPGPIAVNASTFVGYKLLGLVGGLLATLSIVAVPVVVTLCVSAFYEKFKENRLMQRALLGIRPAVVGLIAAVLLDIADISFQDNASIFIFVGGLILLFRMKLHPILVILLGGLSGMLLYS